MALFSILCYTYFFLSAAVGIVGIIAIRLFTQSFDRNCEIVHRFVQAWVKHYFQAIPGWNFSFQGMENVPRDRSYIIVSNHQSAFDVLLLYMLPIPFTWTAKTWVFKMPVIGWLLCLTRALEISGKHPRVFIRNCREVLKQGLSILIFPEGTRSDTGELLPFKYGAFRLSSSENVPILPVVIVGSRHVIPKHKWIHLGLNANVTVKALAPIDPAEFNHDERAMKDHIRSVMQYEIDQLESVALVEDRVSAA